MEVQKRSETSKLVPGGSKTRSEANKDGTSHLLEVSVSLRRLNRQVRLEEISLVNMQAYAHHSVPAEMSPV